MSWWAVFWTWFLVFGLAAFVGLAVVVAIGGLFDIRALFRTLGRRHEHNGSR